PGHGVGQSGHLRRHAGGPHDEPDVVAGGSLRGDVHAARQRSTRRASRPRERPQASSQDHCDLLQRQARRCGRRGEHAWPAPIRRRRHAGLLLVLTAILILVAREPSCEALWPGAIATILLAAWSTYANRAVVAERAPDRDLLVTRHLFIVLLPLLVV